ncbi:MAG: hypothetical protein HC771_09675 [Synechococcales cyanobacterium CRU_2_2]|nr:hypothetical protein [Synechococcales cyanobacterium CRU_2_2]
MAPKASEKSKTWWGKQFLAALESFTDPSRLARGRAYSSNFRLKQFQINADGQVFAQVRGNKNAYFGVTKEPTYITTIFFEPIRRPFWNAVIALIATQAGVISKLMLNEIPDNIEASFQPLGLNLLPKGRQDCSAQCSCPDYSNPCKHIAGVYFRLAQEIDRDPFLLFELRGLSRQALKEELAKSPLGLALSGEMDLFHEVAEPVTSFFTWPGTCPIAPDVTLEDFWLGQRSGGVASEKREAPQLGEASSNAPRVGVPAILIKKQGDFPPFWHRENSFIEAMEEFYQRIRDKNKDVLE